MSSFLFDGYFINNLEVVKQSKNSKNESMQL